MCTNTVDRQSLLDSVEKNVQVPPSSYVRMTRRYRVWTDIVVCQACGLTAKYEDCHPVNPCPNCGNYHLREKSGRWVTTKRPFLGLFGEEVGHWEVIK